VQGKTVTIHSPIDAKRSRMALLTEERRATGIIPTMSVRDQHHHREPAELCRPVVSARFARATKDTRDNIDRLRVKTPSDQTIIANLSGGNQQKVLLGRWLLTQPDILILDEPTRGIDVGAKYEIYTLMIELASRGKAIIMISSEMPSCLASPTHPRHERRPGRWHSEPPRRNPRRRFLQLATKYL